jgi:hypothetical protein
MALGLSTGGSGDYKEIVKYDARAGRMFRVDRDGAGTKTPIDITNEKPKFIIDFGRIEVGWMRFAAGVAPDVAVVPLGQRPTTSRAFASASTPRRRSAGSVSSPPRPSA